MTWMQARHAVVLAVAGAWTVGAAGQPQVRTELVGQWGGCGYAVALDGERAYVGCGPRLLVLDVSDPTDVVELGRSEVFFGTPFDLIVRNDIAYVGYRYGGLRIFDVSDPYAPVHLARPLTRPTWTIELVGDYVLAGNDFDCTIDIVNVSDPAAPTLVQQYPMPDDPKDLRRFGELLYVLLDGELQVFDVSDPESPLLVGETPISHSPEEMDIVGNYAYVASWDVGLEVIDISNPTAPVVIATAPTTYHAFWIDVQGSYAYLTDHWDTLEVFDISVPTDPTRVAVYPSGRDPRKMLVDGDYAYIMNWLSGLRIIDVSDPTAPQLAGLFDVHAHGMRVTVAKQHAYFGGYRRDAMQIIDVSDPSTPLLVGTYPGHPNSVTTAGDLAYMSFAADGLDIVDISDPAHPQWLSNVNTGDEGGAGKVALQGTFAYVAQHVGGLAIVDVADPYAPLVVGRYGADTSMVAEGVAVDGDYAFVTDSDEDDLNEGLVIVDVSDPNAMFEVACQPTSDRPGDVLVDAGIAYVAVSAGGLDIIDISDPHHPQLIANHPATLYRRYNAVRLEGFYLYCLVDSHGVDVFDVSDPWAATRVRRISTMGYAHGVAVADGHLYFADDCRGLTVYALYLPGDMNCDGLINDDDVDPFVLALYDETAYAGAYPNCDILNADTDGNGSVGFEDINPLVALLAKQ